MLYVNKQCTFSFAGVPTGDKYECGCPEEIERNESYTLRSMTNRSGHHKEKKIS